ncbi:MAG: hypothetical protein KF683_14400 [Rubrivivax sp.]|nr:hypothetical protein [Rubrivivax sp.]
MTRRRFHDIIAAMLLGAATTASHAEPPPRRGLLGGLFGPRARWVWTEDPGSRGGLKHVQDRVSGDWAWRECDLRVAAGRRLPETFYREDYGMLMSVDRFDSLGTGGTGMDARQGVVHGPWRRWRFSVPVRQDDLRGRAAHALKLVDEGTEPQRVTRWFFPHPPLLDDEPDVWGPWQQASHARGGAFGWWEEVQGEARQAAPAQGAPEDPHPFELRCRIRLRSVPQPGNAPSAAELRELLQREEPLPR